MVCSSCGYEQESGKFCGKCGTKLEAMSPVIEKGQVVSETNSIVVEQATNVESSDTMTQNKVAAEVANGMAQQAVAEAARGVNQQAATSEYASNVKSSIQIEKVKEQSKMYGSYFMHFVKQPSSIFVRGEREFTNGIISIILVSILVALTLYTFVNNFARATLGNFGDLFMNNYSGPSFMSVFGSTFLFTLASIALVIASLFAISKLFGPAKSFKEIVSIVGAHLTPVIIVGVVALLLILLKSNTYGSVLLSVVIIFTVFVLPLYLISALISKQPRGVDPLYGYVLYIVLFSIVFSIFVSVLADSTVGRYLDELRFW